MFRKRGRKTYYYSDDLLRMREIRWFRAKMVSITAIIVVAIIGLLLVGNYSWHNFLGLGNTRLETLNAENQVLRSDVKNLTSKLEDLQTSLGKLEREGNQMRLMVDLAPMDDATAAAGTGGTSAEPVSTSGISDNASALLVDAKSTMQNLSSQVSLQEQSYEQILKKYDYNKGYFRALPALKPMEGYYSTKEFGLRMHPVLGVFRTHEGLDIVNDVGTPVYAAGDGVIELSGRSGGGYGLVVVIRHGYGYQTLYGHLSKILVREGQQVHRGDCIAKSGRTGLVTGPHLHYEVRYNGVSQNPIDFFLDDVSPSNYQKQIAANATH